MFKINSLFLLMSSIFIFRRDYRLDDNKGLIEACKNSNNVYPVYIFTPEQIDNAKNDYKSHNSVKFLCDSLKELNTMLNNKLTIFYGSNTDILKKCIQAWNVSNVYVNNDYTPYSVSRDEKIEKLSASLKVNFIGVEDVNLVPINTIKPTGKMFYSKFSPFYNKLLNANVDKPIKFKHDNKISKKSISNSIDINTISQFYDEGKIGNHVSEGGRKSGLAILRNISKFADYDSSRDQLIYSTTHMSPHIKYGTISIREAYQAIVSKLGKNSGLLRQLMWHDYFNNLAFNNPDTFKYGMASYAKNVKWIKNKKWLDAWKKGQTGYPIIDSCMTELNQTGYLHNRGRMIVANFLTKILGINWKDGEKYFAQTLYDYDPVQNNMGWAGQASMTGIEARPFNQSVLNPWIQSSKFDKSGAYIKKWLPVLKDVEAKDLHDWENKNEKYSVDYPKPIVDYRDQKEKVLKIYYEARN